MFMKGFILVCCIALSAAYFKPRPIFPKFMPRVQKKFIPIVKEVKVPVVKPIYIQREVRVPFFIEREVPVAVGGGAGHIGGGVGGGVAGGVGGGIDIGLSTQISDADHVNLNIGTAVGTGGIAGSGFDNFDNGFDNNGFDNNGFDNNGFDNNGFDNNNGFGGGRIGAIGGRIGGSATSGATGAGFIDRSTTIVQQPIIGQGQQPQPIHHGKAMPMPLGHHM